MSADELFSKIMIANSGVLTDIYLKFQLNQQTGAVLSIQHTQEAIIVPIELVTPMPNIPSCILGLMNWRSQIIWAVDLSKMFNLESLEHRQQYNVIVVCVDSLLLGLVVQEIQGTIKFLADDIRSPVGQVNSSLVPYLSGCFIQKEEIFLVLNAQHIVNSSMLRND
jgi:twitching motility protein PilI